MFFLLKGIRNVLIFEIRHLTKWQRVNKRDFIRSVKSDCISNVIFALKFHLSSEAKIPLKTEVVRKEKKIIKAKGEDEEEGWVEDKEDEEVELDQYQDQEKEEKEGEEGDKEEEKRKNVMMMD